MIPWGGSYALEAMTDTIEKGAEELLLHVQKSGGAEAALRSGFFQSELQDNATRLLADMEARRRVRVGDNELRACWVPCSEETASGQEELEREQKDRLLVAKKSRSNRGVQNALAALAKGSSEKRTNVLVPVMECVRAGATLGEIVGILRDYFGEYSPPIVF